MWHGGAQALAHETGHFMGLDHTFHINNANNMASTCVDNDQVYDTPTTNCESSKQTQPVFVDITHTLKL